MTRKTYINGKVIRVEQSKIRAGDLLKLAGKDPDKYELQLRRGDKGPVAKTYGGGDMVDLDSDCAGAAAAEPGGPGGGDARAPANAGGGGPAEAAGSGGPGAEGGGSGGGDSGATTTTATTTGAGPDCHFTTRYTGPINPA